MTDGPLGKIYDLGEAAAYLRVTKQAVARAANKSGAGVRFGRDIRFNDDDLKALWEAMRNQPTSTLYGASAGVALNVEKAFANLRKGALAERQSRKQPGLREETLSEKAARLLTNGKRRKP